MLNVRRFVSGPESPLDGVSNDAWARFVTAFEIQSSGAVSDSGGLGAYDIRPRRLVELGYAIGLQSERNAKGRMIRTCSFMLPWTQKRFLTEPIAQYVAFSKSISLYYRALMSGEIQLPEGCRGKAGALAILHKGGTGALKAWPELFPSTKALYESVKGVF